MFQALQKACRRPYSLHSSRREGEKGRTCRELGGAAAVSRRHMHVYKHTPVPNITHVSPFSKSLFIKNVCQRASRLRAEGAAACENKKNEKNDKHKKGTERNKTVPGGRALRCATHHARSGRHDSGTSDAGTAGWPGSTVAGMWCVGLGYKNCNRASTPPRFNGILQSQARGEKAQVLQEEITSLRNKRAIRVVPPEKNQSGFYSRYFLVPKKGGGLRPILDLRALNRYMRQYSFRMLTHAALIRFVRPGGWFTSIDLRDAYFHIAIYPLHRKYLRFAFQGVTYEYLVLPFGLSLSPRVFVKCTEAAIAPLRLKGMRLATYIDDWLLATQSPQEAQAQTSVLISHLVSLGFTINVQKSVLVPTQSITFIGLCLDSVTFKARLSAERVEAFQACLALFRRGTMLKFRTCLRLLGLMASALVVVPLGRLHMRPVQRWVASLRLNPTCHGHRRVLISMACVSALRPWGRVYFLTTGITMGTVLARKVLSTDASRAGWGAVYEGRSVNGTWSSHMQFVHINCLELQAVSLALKHFLPFLRGQHVLVRTDNTTVVAYINRQGGLRSPQMHTLAHRLTIWGNAHLLSLRATHVPGARNWGADLMSRGDPRYKDWKLHVVVVNQIWEKYGRAEVDLFASEENTQCPLFYSLTGRSAPMGLDALAYEWPRVLLYAFPPLELIIPTLARVREKGHALILIAPRWPGKYWLAEIVQLLCSQPWPLPLRRDLLTQAHGEIFHPHPERMALWAWPVKG